MLTLRFVHVVVWMFSFGIFFPGAGVVCGQDYPNKPIRMVTAGIGGGTDFAARIVAQGLTASLGQQVIVDNRPAIFQGAWLRSAPPDGYSIMTGGESQWQVTLLQEMPYDVLRDFSPIVWIGNSPNVLVVHPSVPVKSVKELVDLAKAKPGELNYASSSPGGSAHLAAELFVSLTGVKLVRIAHKSGGDAIISLLGGQGVHLGFISISSVVPQIKAGRLRALGVTSAKPSAAFPGLPTVAETVPGYTSGGQTALFAPQKTPAAIIGRLNRETVRFLNTAEIKEKFANFGVDVVASSPEELRAFIKSDIATWSKVIKNAGIKLE